MDERWYPEESCCSKCMGSLVIGMVPSVLMEIHGRMNTNSGGRWIREPASHSLQEQDHHERFESPETRSLAARLTDSPASSLISPTPSLSQVKFH